jgi:hypothetical protein
MAAAHEQDVRSVDLQEFLLRVLAAALRRHRGDCALNDLEQRLLHALAGHVAGDRRIVGLAADLVDLVDVDDAALRALATRKVMAGLLVAALGEAKLGSAPASRRQSQSRREPIG